MSSTPREWLTWKHAGKFAIAYAVAGGLVLLATRTPRHALGTILGPFAGGVARDWRSCCAENSLALAPCGCAGLGLGLIAQILVQPRTALLHWSRRIAWWLACAGWFFSAFVSYGHALE